MRTPHLALAVAALATPALAQSDPNIPVLSPYNANMRVVAYNPLARVQIVGNVGRATVITLARDEEVIRVLVGDGGSDKQTWEGPSPEEVQNSPLENIVYLYPKNAGYTSITIITKGPRGQRAYQFGALARGVPPCGRAACDDPDATYGLAFTYPDDEKAERAEAARRGAEERRVRWEAEAPLRQARAETAQNAAMRARLDTDHLAGGPCRNWRYEGEANDAGHQRIVPDEVTDNGQETTFVFRGNREVPAFALLGADGAAETPVFPVLRGPDTLVLQAVAPSRQPGRAKLTGDIRLRLGGAVVYIDRVGDLPASCVSQTGTASPDVARVIRRASPRPAANRP